MKNLLTYIIGTLISLSIVIAIIIFVGSPILLFWDLPSAIYILVVLVGIIIATGMKDFAKGFYFAFTDNPNISQQEVKSSYEVFSNLSKSSIIGGIIGTIIGLVSIMANIRNLESVGYGASVSILVTLYSIMISVFIFLPIKTLLKKKLSKIGSD